MATQTWKIHLFYFHLSAPNDFRVTSLSISMRCMGKHGCICCCFSAVHTGGAAQGEDARASHAHTEGVPRLAHEDALPQDEREPGCHIQPNQGIHGKHWASASCRIGLDRFEKSGVHTWSANFTQNTSIIVIFEKE